MIVIILTTFLLLSLFSAPYLFVVSLRSRRTAEAICFTIQATLLHPPNPPADAGQALQRGNYIIFLIPVPYIGQSLQTGIL